MTMRKRSAIWQPLQDHGAARRQVGFYPIRGGKVAAFFAHVSKDPALPADPVAELRRVSGDLGWLVPKSLDQAVKLPGIYYDQIAQIEMDRWSKGRVTLVSDAVDAMWLRGQGASLAMGTSYVLAEELRTKADVPSALDGYQQRLLADVRKKQNPAARPRAGSCRKRSGTSRSAT